MTVYRWRGRERSPTSGLVVTSGSSRLMWMRGRRRGRSSPLPCSTCLPTALTLPPVCRTKDRMERQEVLARWRKPNQNLASFGNGVYQRITKQGIVRWCISYYDATGKRVQRVVRNAQSEEEALLARQLGRVRGIPEATWDPSKARPNQLRRLLRDLYIENYAKINKRSWNTDVSYLKSLSRSFGSLYLDEIGPLEIREVQGPQAQGWRHEVHDEQVPCGP